MKRPLLVLLVALPLTLLGAIFLASRGELPDPTPDPTGTFSFAALGDAPYNLIEDRQYRLVLADLAAHPLTHVVHVGDILGGRCTDARYDRTLREFNALPHPVIYTPGDNEWTDCAGVNAADRLAALRARFFAQPSRSLGGRTVPLDHQQGEYVEHARWLQDEVLFATVHLVGSRNGQRRDEAEAKRRTEAAALWTRETFAVARLARVRAVVLAMHIMPFDSVGRGAYQPFVRTLEDVTAAAGVPVLIVHGDQHEFTVDHPLRHHETGAIIRNVTRLQVPGSPDVGWVRVNVDPASARPFSFERRVVPRYKLW